MYSLPPELACQLARQNMGMGRLAEGEALCRDVLQRAPDFVDALHLLGVIACQDGRFEPAVECLGRAISLDPQNASHYSNYGTALQALGRLDEAIAAHQTATRLVPGAADVHYNLANALRDAGRLEAAVGAYRAALSLQGGDAEARSNLGSVLNMLGQHGKAAEECCEAMRHDAGFLPAYNNLAIALQGQGLPESATEVCRRVLAMSPDFAEAHHTLGSALKDGGQMDEAIAAFRRAVALRPDDARMHSTLIYALHFQPDYHAGAIATEAACWNERHAVPQRHRIRPHDNDRNPDRRLKIGYVSPDFRDHVVGRSLEPVFRERDRDGFEVFCYSGVVQPDGMTERLRSHVDHWRAVAGLSDVGLAEQIREDGIDILVDLTLHMAGNRLRALACKPAPVQLSFAGYPGSAGVEDIPYHLSDRYLEPPEMGGQYAFDEAIRLESFWCYDPIEGGPAVNTLPGLEAGAVTFGCLNNFCKVNPGVLELWGQVLNRVPRSRLLLLSPAGGHRQAVLDRLNRQGVDVKRVEFVEWQPRAQYLACHHRMDIALDTFPYNGHTTSLDAMWMGVPVVTLAGQVPVARGTLSILTNLGLGELVAESEADFVRVAEGLANDLPRLTELRRTLRARMEASLLMDAPRFARNIEAAYRMLWQRWCG